MKFERAAAAVLVAIAMPIPACNPASQSANSDQGGSVGASHAGSASSGQPNAAGGQNAAGMSASAGQAGVPGTAGSGNPGGGAGGAAATVAGAANGGGGASQNVAGNSAGGAGGHAGFASGSSGASGKPTFHVFLLLGQSNMAGYPKAQAADKVKDERIKVLGFDACAATGRVQDKWDVAVAPLHECWNGALGPGDYFAKTLINVIPAGDSIGLVPCAVSGEKIETFLKSGGSKYSWIIARAKLAQDAGGVIDGMLFHQGESNCGDASWPGKVNTLVTDLRKDLNLGNAPFLAGELAPTGACSQHNTLVGKLPSVVSNAFVVSAAGLALDPADTQYRLHFDHDSQVTFGKRYEAAMVQALHW